MRIGSLRTGLAEPMGCGGGCLVLLVTLAVCAAFILAIYFSLKEFRSG